MIYKKLANWSKFEQLALNSHHCCDCGCSPKTIHQVIHSFCEWFPVKYSLYSRAVPAEPTRLRVVRAVCPNGFCGCPIGTRIGTPSVHGCPIDNRYNRRGTSSVAGPNCATIRQSALWVSHQCWNWQGKCPSCGGFVHEMKKDPTRWQWLYRVPKIPRHSTSP